MSFFDTIKYTNEYPHLAKLLPVYRLFKNKKITSASIKDFIKNYKNAAVLASGPSLNLCKPNKETLYITTNSSYLYLKGKFDFIHVIKDLGFLNKLLLFGLKYNPKLLIIEVPTHSNGQGFGKITLNVINKYLKKRKFNFPIVICNNENLAEINPKSYYNDRSNFTLEKVGTQNPDSNSGLMIYAYGFWITETNSNIKSCNIYGLDAGEGGKRYFNNLKTLPNHVAMRDQNKIEMGNFIEECQSKFSSIKNYSYFKNNVE